MPFFSKEEERQKAYDYEGNAGNLRRTPGSPIEAIQSQRFDEDATQRVYDEVKRCHFAVMLALFCIAEKEDEEGENLSLIHISEPTRPY